MRRRDAILKYVYDIDLCKKQHLKFFTNMTAAKMYDFVNNVTLALATLYWKKQKEIRPLAAANHLFPMYMLPYIDNSCNKVCPTQWYHCENIATTLAEHP